MWPNKHRFSAATVGETAPRSHGDGSLYPPDEATEKKQDDCAECGETNRSQVERAGVDSTPAEARAQKAADDGSHDPKNDRDYTTRGIPPWHKELGQCSRYQTQKNPVEPERHS